MTTYEDLVDATLPYGLMPLVVPQLKTITLGGAVTGLGIESTLVLRNGLLHESVPEMELLTGDGRVVTATKDAEHSDLFHGFPNSYGTLGYALGLTIELSRSSRTCTCAHFRFSDPKTCMTAITEIARRRQLPGPPGRLPRRDGLRTAELYLTVGAVQSTRPRGVSDYTGQDIYYLSLQRRREDFLTVKDYLWRWDTDWFWCSRRVRRAERGGPPAVAAPVPALATCTASWSRSTGSTG